MIELFEELWNTNFQQERDIKTMLLSNRLEPTIFNLTPNQAYFFLTLQQIHMKTLMGFRDFVSDISNYINSSYLRNDFFFYLMNLLFEDINIRIKLLNKKQRLTHCHSHVTRKACQKKGVSKNEIINNVSVQKIYRPICNHFDKSAGNWNFKPSLFKNKLKQRERKSNLHCTCKHGFQPKYSQNLRNQIKNTRCNQLCPLQDSYCVKEDFKKSLKLYMKENAAKFEENKKTTVIYESLGDFEAFEFCTKKKMQHNIANFFIDKMETSFKCDVTNNNKKSSYIKHTNKPLKTKLSTRWEHIEANNMFSSTIGSNVKKLSTFRIKQKFSKCCSQILAQCIKASKHKNRDDPRSKVHKPKDLEKQFKIGNIEHGVYLVPEIPENSFQISNYKYMNQNKINQTLNNLNSHKHMKKKKLIKSLSDSCVAFPKNSKLNGIKCRKNKINSLFHNCKHGSELMEATSYLQNKNNRLQFRKGGYMECNLIIKSSDSRVNIPEFNDGYKYSKNGKSYSNDNIKDTGKLKNYLNGKCVINKTCGDSKINDLKCFFDSKKSHTMPQSSHSNHSNKNRSDLKYPQHAYNQQCCFADPEIYYCDSDKEISHSELISCKVKPETKIMVEDIYLENGSEHLQNKNKKENLNSLEEEVYEASGGPELKLLDGKKKSLKREKNKHIDKKTMQEKSIKGQKLAREWSHNLAESESEEISENIIKKIKDNSELTILSDYGLNCDSFISNSYERSRERPITPTVMRDVGISAVSSFDILRSSRSTIDKAVMCDEINYKESNSELSERIENNDNDKKSEEKRIVQNNIIKTLYQGENQTRYLEWYKSQEASASNHSCRFEGALETFSSMSQDEFFLNRDGARNNEETPNGIKFSSDFKFISDKDTNQTQPKNIWSSLKTSGQKVFSFLQPIGPLRTCFKKNIF